MITLPVSIENEDEKVIKSLNEEFETTKENLNKYLAKFELATEIEKSKKYFKTILKLQMEIKKIVNHMELEFNLTPYYIKKKYKPIITKNFEAVEEFEIIILKKDTQLNGFIASNKQLEETFNKDGRKIGDKYQKVNFSKVDSVKSTSQDTYDKVKIFIEDTEEDLKQRPLITEKDPSYNYYLEYNEVKQEILLMEKNLIWKRRLKCSLCTLLLLAIIGVVLVMAFRYFIL